MFRKAFLRIQKNIEKFNIFFVCNDKAYKHFLTIYS